MHVKLPEAELRRRTRGVKAEVNEEENARSIAMMQEDEKRSDEKIGDESDECIINQIQ